MRLFPVIILMLAASFCENGLAQVKSQKEVISIKCPVMPGRDVKPDLSLPFEGGQVYFCCKNCLAKFESNPEKYQKAAKQQLQMTAKKAKGQKQKIQSKAELSSRKIELEKLLKELADAVESGELTKEQATEKYNYALGQQQKPKAGKKSSEFSRQLKELVEAGKLTKEEAMELYKAAIKDQPKALLEKKSKIPSKKSKLDSTDLEKLKKLSDSLPLTSTGNDLEGPTACGFFGWAADATHRFMDNSHLGEPREIHGLSFRLDYRDHDSIGRDWDNITVRVAHGDWDSIKYNASKAFKLKDEQQVVFDKAWSFPTLKGFPPLEPAEWGGPQNCLNFRFDQPFNYNGKDPIYVEFIFDGGKTEDGRTWEGDLPYGFEYYLDSMPEAGGWRVAENPRGLYRSPRVEAVVSYTAGGQSVWTSAAKGMPYLKWDFK